MIGNPKPHKKKKKPTAIPKPIVKAVFERDSNICAYCGVLTAGLDPDSILISSHCHHIVKRRKAGCHKEELLNTCCFRCHSLHGAISRIDKEWLSGEDVYYSGRVYGKLEHNK